MGNKEKVPLGTFTKKEDIELINKLDMYLEEVNKHNKNYTSRLNFLSSCIKEKLEGKVLTNDRIKLDKPFYFNYMELKTEGVITATTEEPIHDLELTFIVKAVPNNLDVWNIKEETYSSGRPSTHKGIFILYWIIFNSEDPFKVVKIVEKYFILKYDSEENSLEISLINPNDLYLYVPTGSNVLDKLEEDKDSFYNSIVNKNNYINLNEWLKNLEVMFPYKMVKEISDYTSTDRFKELSERFDNAEKVVYTNEEGITEEGVVLAAADVEDFYNFVLNKSLKFYELEKD